jgi:hypothetical protein
MPSGNVSRLVWSAMLVLLAVLAFKARDHFTAYFAGVGKLDVEARPDEATVYLRWRGNIDAPMASRLAEASESNKDARTFVLSLSSPGGSIDHGAEVVRVLRTIRKTHTLVTRVQSGDLCASMCVPIYLQGQQRLAAADAEFMFHEVNYRDFFSNEVDRDVPDSAISAETDRLFVKYFEAAGASAGWIRRVRSEVAGGREVWETGRELVDEKSGVVQHLL